MRQTQTGIPVASFNLAVQVPSKDKNTPPDWIPVVCWRDTATFAQNYLTKGRQVVVQGRISTREYTAKDGTKRKAVEVVASHIYFADSQPTGNAGTGYQYTAPAAPAGGSYQGNEGFTQVDDDELPF